MILDDPLAVNQAIQNAELSIDKLLFKTKNSGKFYLEKENVYIDPANIITCMDRFGQVSLEGLNLDQAKKDDAAMTVAFETYQYLCTGELQTGEIKEDAFCGGQRKRLNHGCLRHVDFFLLSECGRSAPDEALAFIL